MGMSGEWTLLARTHGRKAVMSLTIDDITLDQETDRQIPILFGMIGDQLLGNERCGLDFGCGAGRLTHALAKTIRGRVTGYDPCAALVSMARGEIDTDYVSGPPEEFFYECHHNGTEFDVIMVAQVLGAPGIDLEATATGLIDVLSRDGLMVVIDHMPSPLPIGRWWHYRPVAFYQELFRGHGVELRQIGKLMQLENEVTVLAGRPTGGSPA